MTIYEKDGPDRQVEGPPGEPWGEVAYEPPSWLQLVHRVADGSVSMTWPLSQPDKSIKGQAVAMTKGAGVGIATSDLLNRLAAGTKGANFLYASAVFCDRVTEERPPRPVIDVPSNENHDPTANGTGGTRIWLGLEAAERAVAKFHIDYADGVPLSTVVLVQSDGECEDPAATIAAAKRLAQQPNTHIAACLFGTRDQPPRGARLLQAIVTDPSLYSTVYTADQLRRFFHDSVTAVTQAARAQVR